MGQADCFLNIKEVHKSFSHVKALSGVSLSASRGEVLAIVGDNGAGKSTLIKILSGVLKPDVGEIQVEGVSYGALSPRGALAAGISTVYQDLALADTRSVADNVFLGRERMKGCFLAKKQMEIETEQLMRKLGIHIPDVRVPVGILSGGQRQATAVARAIHQGGKLFIFDEPTAAMGLVETGTVLRLIEKLGRDGYGVIVISHNMQQVFQVAHRICVMRHGKVISVVEAAKTQMGEVVSLITGASTLGGNWVKEARYR